jgi:hypothetical protein
LLPFHVFHAQSSSYSSAGQQQAVAVAAASSSSTTVHRDADFDLPGDTTDGDEDSCSTVSSSASELAAAMFGSAGAGANSDATPIRGVPLTDADIWAQMHAQLALQRREIAQQQWQAQRRIIEQQQAREGRAGPRTKKTNWLGPSGSGWQEPYPASNNEEVASEASIPPPSPQPQPQPQPLPQPQPQPQPDAQQTQTQHRRRPHQTAAWVQRQKLKQENAQRGQ